jgi:hypothetical protein
MGSNIYFIDNEVISFIKENPDLFRKHLYQKFRFIELNLTHWSLKIDFPKDYLISLTLKHQHR